MSKAKLTRLAIAIRIRDAVLPALANRKLFNLKSRGLRSVWSSEGFRIRSIVTSNSVSFEVWPVANEAGQMLHRAAGKVINLARMNDGTYELVSFLREIGRGTSFDMWVRRWGCLPSMPSLHR